MNTLFSRYQLNLLISDIGILRSISLLSCDILIWFDREDQNIPNHVKWKIPLQDNNVIELSPKEMKYLHI